MRKKIFTFLLALAASLGMSWATTTYVTITQNDFPDWDESFTKDGVTVSAGFIHGELGNIMAGEGDGSFSTTLGNFTKIEVNAMEVDISGEGWSGDHEHKTWTGNASSVSFSGEIMGNGQGVTLKFTIGDPLPTYTVALEAGTANANKVTLSKTSAVEGATITVTPDEEYEITAFSAKYNTTEEAPSTLDPGTGAYSFTMPAYDVTIEATIALKPVPEGDIFAGFTATAGSGGFNNEGHANLVDNKFTSADWTKWCADNSYKSVPTGESGDACWWIDFEASAALNPTGYILTTGNDTGNEHGRNPKNWVLKAKLNADDAWTTIATVTNDVTMKNKSFKDYKFFVDQSGTYQYFRFEVFANQGAGVMQLCELRLIGTEPVVVTTHTLQLHVNDALMGSVALQNPSNDIIDNGDGTYTVPEGATVTLIATPNEGYEFTGWKASSSICDFNECEFDALSTVDNPLTVDMYMTAAFMAEFAAVAPTPTPTVYNSGSVALSNLNVGDILMAGVTLTDDSGSKVKFVPSRLAITGNIRKSELTVANFVNSLQTPLLGENAAMTFPGGVIIITPIDEEGNDGNAWEVTEINVAEDTPVALAGITYSGTTPTPTPAEDVDITPNVDPQNPTVYYSTFYDSNFKYELPTGVEAYIVTTVSGDVMQLQKVADAGQTIPAGAGVILKSSVTPFTLTVSDAEAVSVEGNRLEGSDISIATPANCYVLAGNDGVGFYHYTASMLNPHKAYIIYTPNSGNQAPRRLRFAFETATGVENVQNSDIRSQKVVENGQLIIIRNGVRYNAAGQNVK